MAFPCIVCGVSFDKSNHLQRHILTRKHQINNEFHSILRGKTSGDQKLQFVLPAEDTCTPAETEQSQDPPPIDHGDVLFSDGKKNNELESDDIEVCVADIHSITTYKELLYALSHPYLGNDTYIYNILE